MPSTHVDESSSSYGRSTTSGYSTAPLPGGAGVDPYASPEAWVPQPDSTGLGAAPSPGASFGPGPGAPSGAPPSSPPRRSRAGLVVGLVVAALVLGLTAVGWFVWPGWGISADPPEPGGLPSPTAEPTSAPSPGATDADDGDPDATGPGSTQPTGTGPTSPDPTTQPTTEPPSTAGGAIVDGQLVGPGYRFPVPDGWTLSPDSGEYNDGELVDDRGTRVTVYVMRQGLAYCQHDAELLEIWVPGELAPLPDREVGGLATTGTSLTGDDGSYHALYCTAVGEIAYEIALETTTGLQSTLVPVLEEMLDGWAWA